MKFNIQFEYKSSTFFLPFHLLQFQTCLLTLQNDEEIFTSAKIVSFTSTQLSVVLRPALMSAAGECGSKKTLRISQSAHWLEWKQLSNIFASKGGSWPETTTRQASSAVVSLHAVIRCLQMKVWFPETCGCFLTYFFFKAIYSLNQKNEKRPAALKCPPYRYLLISLTSQTSLPQCASLILSTQFLVSEPWSFFHFLNRI